MSLKFDKYVHPDHCQAKFDWESGTPLLVETYTDGIYEGEVKVTEHSFKQNNIFLELVNATKPMSNKGPAEYHQFIRFEAREIKTVQVLGPPNVLRCNRAIERIHHTCLIQCKVVFDKYIQVFLDTMIAEVAINFFGNDVGRNGELYCIAMLVDDTLLVIDCIEMIKQDENFMVRLDKALFSNQSILKVVYNSRPIADYLYHRHSIFLKNVFDIQAVDFYLRASEQNVNEIEKTKEHLMYKPLSECLLKYIGTKKIPVKELRVLKEYEEKEQKFSQFNYLELLAHKWVAIEVKYLLQLRDVMNKRTLKNVSDCVTTNMTYHVSSNPAFFNTYDGSDNLAIPPAVIKQLLDAKFSKTNPVSHNEATSRLG